RDMAISVAEYANAKRLDPNMLISDFQLRDIRYPPEGPAILIPYFDLNGRELPPRFRVALDGPGKFRQRKGSSPSLYGLWKMPTARGAAEPSILLCEGESDVHTFYGRPDRPFHAVGIPGANTWRDEWASLFEGFHTIFLVVEPDTGGEALLFTVARS